MFPLSLFFNFSLKCNIVNQLSVFIISCIHISVVLFSIFLFSFIFIQLCLIYVSFQLYVTLIRVILDYTNSYRYLYIVSRIDFLPSFSDLFMFRYALYSQRVISRFLSLLMVRSVPTIFRSKKSWFRFLLAPLLYLLYKLCLALSNWSVLFFPTNSAKKLDRSFISIFL